MPVPLAAAAGKALAKKAATSKAGRRTAKNGCYFAVGIIVLPVFLFLALISVFVNALLKTTDQVCTTVPGTTGSSVSDAAIAAGAINDAGLTDKNQLIVMTAIAGSQSNWNVTASTGGAQGLWGITKAEDPQDFPPQQPDTKYLLSEDNNAAAALRLSHNPITTLAPWKTDGAYLAFANAGGVKNGTFNWGVAATLNDSQGLFAQARTAVATVTEGSPTPSGSASATADTSGACCPGSSASTTGSGGATSAQQTQYARMIIGIAKTMNMGTQGEMIGLMVALDESGLQEYANSSVPSSLSYPHDAVGSDHGSVGIFQQQVNPDGSNFGWGTLDQLMNPTDGKQYQAYRFFKALQGVNGWQNMQPWQAAQAVQKSGTSDGSNYQAKMGQAQQILNSNSDAPAVALPAGASAGNGGGAAGGAGCSSGGIDGYINPIKPGWFGPARTDMGVDWLPNSPNTPILAIGDAVITYSQMNSGWPNGSCGTCGGYMTYKLSAGPKAGYCIYVAENLTQMKPQGTVVKAGDQIAFSQPGYAWTEWGWAKCAPPGQYGGPATPYNGAADGTPMPGGKAMARFFTELGAKPLMDPGPGPDVPY